MDRYVIGNSKERIMSSRRQRQILHNKKLEFQRRVEENKKANDETKIVKKKKSKKEEE